MESKSITTSISMISDETTKELLIRLDKFFATFITQNTPEGYKFSFYTLTPSADSYSFDLGTKSSIQTVHTWRIEIWYKSNL